MPFEKNPPSCCSSSSDVDLGAEEESAFRAGKSGEGDATRFPEKLPTDSSSGAVQRHETEALISAAGPTAGAGAE